MKHQGVTEIATAARDGHTPVQYQRWHTPTHGTCNWLYVPLNELEPPSSSLLPPPVIYALTYTSGGQAS